MGNARGKSMATSAPISVLTGPPSGSGRLSRSNSRSNTAVVGPLNQASGSNVPVSLLPRPRVNQNIFPGLSTGSDCDYCTWLSKNNLAPLLGAPSYRLFDAGFFQGTLVNPTRTALLVRDGGLTRQPLTSLCMQGSLQSFTRRHSSFRRLNRPIPISLSCLCHHVLSVTASPTRPCQLTPVKHHPTAFYTQWRCRMANCFGGSIRTSCSTATGSPLFNLFT